MMKATSGCVVACVILCAIGGGKAHSCTASDETCDSAGAPRFPSLLQHKSTIDAGQALVVEEMVKGATQLKEKREQLAELKENSRRRKMPVDIICRDIISDDCQTLFDNAKSSDEMAELHHRCKNEGGASPLRMRCALCCPPIQIAPIAPVPTDQGLPCLGTFISNEGKRYRYPGAGPWLVGGVWVYGAAEAGLFKMVSVDATGKKLEERHSRQVGMTNDMSPAQRQSVWDGATRWGAGYSVEVILCFQGTGLICACSGHSGDGGQWGAPDCKTSFRGVPFCYTWPGACQDGVKSTKEVGQEWSHEACPLKASFCECSGHSGEGGQWGAPDCKTRTRGAPFCYTLPGACQDGVKSTKEAGQEWSHEACWLVRPPQSRTLKPMKPMPPPPFQPKLMR